MSRRSIFIADQANDEDEDEDAVRADDDEEDGIDGEENVEGLIADKVEKDKRGTHLAAMAKARQELEKEEEAQLAAAEERYAALGANYARDTRDTQTYEPGEFSELAIAARVEAAKVEAAREKAAKAEAARLAQRRQRAWSVSGHLGSHGWRPAMGPAVRARAAPRRVQLPTAPQPTPAPTPRREGPSKVPQWGKNKTERATVPCRSDSTLGLAVGCSRLACAEQDLGPVGLGAPARSDAIGSGGREVPDGAEQLRRWRARPRRLRVWSMAGA